MESDAGICLPFLSNRITGQVKNVVLVPIARYMKKSPMCKFWGRPVVLILKT